MQRTSSKAPVKSMEWVVPKEQTASVTLVLWSIVVLGLVLNTLLLVKLFTVKRSPVFNPSPPVLINLCLSNLLLVLGAFLAALTLSFDLGSSSVKVGEVELFLSVGILLQSWLGQLMLLFLGLTPPNLPHRANTPRPQQPPSITTDRAERWGRPHPLHCSSASKPCLYRPGRRHSRLTQTFQRTPRATGASAVRSRAVLEASSSCSVGSRGRQAARWWLLWSWLLSLLAATALLMMAPEEQDGCLTLTPFQSTYIIAGEDLGVMRVRENSLNKAPFLLVLLPVYGLGVGAIVWSVITTRGSQWFLNLRKRQHATAKKTFGNTIATWAPISLSNLTFFKRIEAHSLDHEEVQMSFDSDQAEARCDMNVNAIGSSECLPATKREPPGKGHQNTRQGEIGIGAVVNVNAVINPSTPDHRHQHLPQWELEDCRCIEEEASRPSNHSDVSQLAHEEKLPTLLPKPDENTEVEEAGRKRCLTHYKPDSKQEAQNPAVVTLEAQQAGTARTAQSKENVIFTPPSPCLKLLPEKSWSPIGVNRNNSASRFPGKNPSQHETITTSSSSSSSSKASGARPVSGSQPHPLQSSSSSSSSAERAAGGPAEGGKLQPGSGTGERAASWSSSADFFALGESNGQLHTEASPEQRSLNNEPEASDPPEVSNLRQLDNPHPVSHPRHHNPPQTFSRHQQQQQQGEGLESHSRGKLQGGLRPSINIVSSSMHHFTIQGRPPWQGRFELYPPGWLKQERFPLLPSGHSSRQQCLQQQQQQGMAEGSSRKKRHGGARSRLSWRSSQHRKASHSTCKPPVRGEAPSTSAEIHTSVFDARSEHRSSNSGIASEASLQSHFREPAGLPEQVQSRNAPTDQAKAEAKAKAKGKASSSWISYRPMTRDEDTAAFATESSGHVPPADPSSFPAPAWRPSPALSRQKMAGLHQPWSSGPRHVRLVPEGQDQSATGQGESSTKLRRFSSLTKEQQQQQQGQQQQGQHHHPHHNTGAGGGDSYVSTSAKPKRLGGQRWWRSFQDGLSFRAKCGLGLTMHVTLCLPLAVTLIPGVFQDSDCGSRLKAVLVARLLLFCHAVCCPVWMLGCFLPRLC